MDYRAWRSIPLLAVILIIAGCDPLTRHHVLSTVLDGVPTMPPAESYCQEYHERQREIEKRQEAAALSGKEPQGLTTHQPYGEKRCDDCHDKAKGQGGLKLPPQQLCFSCHTDILAGSFAHGPAAVGDCLACHLPHSSGHPSLLVVAREDICSACHREKRQAVDMHDRFTKRGVACADCHNPHASPIRYFLY